MNTYKTTEFYTLNYRIYGKWIVSQERVYQNKKDYESYYSPIAKIWVDMSAVVVAIIIAFLLSNKIYINAL